MCVCFVSWTWSGGAAGGASPASWHVACPQAPQRLDPPPPRLPAPRPCSAKLAAWRCQPLTHLPLKPEPWPFQPRPAPFRAFRPTPSLRPQDPHAAAAGTYPLFSPPAPPPPFTWGLLLALVTLAPTSCPWLLLLTCLWMGCGPEGQEASATLGAERGLAPRYRPQHPPSASLPKCGRGGGWFQAPLGQGACSTFQGAGSQVGLGMLSPKHGLRRPHPNAAPAPKAEPQKGTFSDRVSGQAHPACCVGGG